MENITKKEELLQEVEYTNLLSLTLIEGKLTRNFTAIVEALRLSQNTADQAKMEAQNAHNKNMQLEKALAEQRQQYGRDHGALRNAINQLRQTLAQPRQAKANDEGCKENEVESLPSPASFESAQVTTPIQPLDSREWADKKELQGLMEEVKGLKEKIPTVDLIEQEIKQTKKDLMALKAELKALSQRKQVPSARRESNLRRDSASKPQARASINVKPESSGVLPDLANKENQPSAVVLTSVQSKEEVISDKRMTTPRDNVVEGQSVGATNYDKEIEGLQMEINTLNLGLQELKDYVDELRKRDIRVTSSLVDLQKKDKQIMEQASKDTERLQNQIKNLRITAIINTPQQTNAPAVEKDSSQNDKEHKKEEKTEKAERKERDRQRSERRSKQSTMAEPETSNLHNMVLQLQSALADAVTDSQFQRFKEEIRAKFADLQGAQTKLETEHEEDIKKLEDMFINRDIEAKRMAENIAQIEEQAKEAAAQVERKHNIAIARAHEVKKGLQNLREDMEFYQSLLTDKEKGAQGKGEGKGSGQTPQVDTKAIQDLKRHTHNKLHDQRAYLVGLIRDLQKKMQAASSVNQQITNIWDKTNQINLLLGRKADNEDMRKQMAYLQRKMGKVLAQLSKPDDTEDARVARTNWYCLSCDKNLMSYQGKVGKHVVWDTMPLKGVVKGLDKKGSLPSLKVKV